MTEREKMLSGKPYCSADAELRSISNMAKALMKEYNMIPAEDDVKRAQILHKMFGFCGENVRVNQPLYVDYGCNISVGNDTIINLGCTLLDTNKITIGERVLIAPDVKIYTAYHPKKASERFLYHDGKYKIVTLAKPVTIGNDSWIGGGSIILPGVTIGKNTIIGAGSVVTKDIPDNVIAYGNPCRVMKQNKEG